MLEYYIQKDTQRIIASRTENSNCLSSKISLIGLKFSDVLYESCFIVKVSYKPPKLANPISGIPCTSSIPEYSPAGPTEVRIDENLANVVCSMVNGNGITSGFRGERREDLAEYQMLQQYRLDASPRPVIKREHKETVNRRKKIFPRFIIHASGAYISYGFEAAPR